MGMESVWISASASPKLATVPTHLMKCSFCFRKTSKREFMTIFSLLTGRTAIRSVWYDSKVDT